MKYEFHVGDYVETKDGYTGYVKSFITYYNKDLKDDVVDLVCIEERNGRNRKESMWVLSGTIPRHFNRIGRYDFTKSEQPKEIKKLPDGYGDGYMLYKGTATVDGKVDNGWVSIGILSSKINELVDAINKLQKEHT